VPSYNSEVELRNALGIDSWRNLSKDTFLRFLDELPDVDPEVALKLLEQVPEITSLARGAIDDATKIYEAALTSNARSQEMVHEVHLKRLEILKSELEKGLSPDERMRVLDEIREVNANALQMDAENKRFLSDQFDKKLLASGVAAAAVLGLVFAAARSGMKPTLEAVRTLRP
jgi:hypothetical protein